MIHAVLEPADLVEGKNRSKEESLAGLSQRLHENPMVNQERSGADRCGLAGVGPSSSLHRQDKRATSSGTSGGIDTSTACVSVGTEADAGTSSDMFGWESEDLCWWLEGGGWGLEDGGGVVDEG